jgi:ribonuclease P protein component
MGMYSLPKSQRLTRATDIKALFQQGASLHLHPLRVVFANAPAAPHRVFFSVAKRYVKSAVHRNKIKRRMRECYRLNKHRLPPAPARQIAFLYISPQIASYQTLHRAVLEAIEKIALSAK